MGTFISVYSVISMNKNIINNMEFNMNLITLKRKYNGLAVKLNRTDDEQKEMDRLEALIPNTSNAMITLLRAHQGRLERDVALDRTIIESSASIECILQELMETLTINLKRLKEIEREIKTS